MIIAGTGHRPDKLYLCHRSRQFWYSLKATKLLALFLEQQLRELEPSCVVSGMALGYDQALAIAAIRCKVPVYAYIPCLNHGANWRPRSVQLYTRIVERCEKVTVAQVPYSPRAMYQRNIDMIEVCDVLLAMWNGTPGGTKNCLWEAEKRGTEVLNVWGVWEDYYRGCIRSIATVGK